MGHGVVADFMAVGYGLFPALQTVADILRLHKESHLRLMLAEHSQSCVHLARPRVIKAEADCRPLFTRPPKWSGLLCWARPSRFLCCDFGAGNHRPG